MMDITKSREEFEANYAKKLRSNFDGNIYRTERYVSLNVQAHWETWQAARESIEVELPFNDIRTDEKDEIWDRAVESCADALRTAGIRIKGESE
ncbi:hypothetical protein [Yersinia enterocolitica]|uniref:hypothetical protein n=1 Tax=Yersinia enterocolitica TaxID=630 RepID=UPI00398D0C2E